MKTTTEAAITEGTGIMVTTNTSTITTGTTNGFL
jgi:hypothetical protein